MQWRRRDRSGRRLSRRRSCRSEPSHSSWRFRWRRDRCARGLGARRTDGCGRHLYDNSALGRLSRNGIRAPRAAMEGHFGQYGPGAFVEQLPVHNAPRRQSAQSLHNSSWIDGATRAVMAEVSTHSGEQQARVAQFTAEFPPAGSLAIVTAASCPLAGFPMCRLFKDTLVAFVKGRADIIEVWTTRYPGGARRVNSLYLFVVKLRRRANFYGLSSVA